MTDIETLNNKIIEMERYFKNKIEAIEMELVEFKNNKSRSKKKTNAIICKELNEKNKDITFKEWTSNIEITNTHIEQLSKISIIEYFQLILNGYVRITESIPIVSYDKKLFIHNEKWELLKNNDFEKMIFHIQQKTMKELIEWEKNLDFNNAQNVNTMLVVNEKILCPDSKNIIKFLKKYIINHIQTIS
jgi:hypothetical protein